jgi:hypothetical protein
LVVQVSAQAGEPAGDTDWPTLQHDFQRTGHTPACPKPPWRVRWVWCNGQKIDRSGVRADYFGIDKLPDFLSVRFVSHVQPMVYRDVAYVGSVEGQVYAIDVATGETRWKAQASGPILHSLAIADSTVLAPTMRGVDAFNLQGTRLWRFDDLRLGGFWSSPAYSDGAVLIGSLSGYFYAIDAKTGKQRWVFRAGAPIAHCPAVFGDAVYFAAEDMHAYSIDVADGKLKWKSDRMHGLTVKHSWPVVAAEQGAVIFRTASVTNDHALMRAVERAPEDYDKAQDAMREAASQKPYDRTMYVLDLDSGEELVTVVSGYLGLDEVPAPPIVLAAPVETVDGRSLPAGTALGWHWSKGGAFQPNGRFHGYSSPVDFGAINFKTGRFERIGPVGSLQYPTIVRNDDFHHNTVGGKYLFGIQHGLAWGAVPLDEKARYTCGGGIHYAYQRMGKLGVTWPGVRFALGFVAPTITQDAILLNPLKGVFFAALETDPEK